MSQHLPLQMNRRQRTLLASSAALTMLTFVALFIFVQGQLTPLQQAPAFRATLPITTQLPEEVADGSKVVIESFAPAIPVAEIPNVAPQQ